MYVVCMHVCTSSAPYPILITRLMTAALEERAGDGDIYEPAVEMYNAYKKVAHTSVDFDTCFECSYSISIMLLVFLISQGPVLYPL